MNIYALIVMAVLFWSGNFVLGRLVSPEIEPMQLALFRWALVLILLLPYIFLLQKVIFSAIKNNFLILLVLSFLGVTGFNTILYYGLQETTATNSLLINSSIPIIIIVLNTLFTKEPITFTQIIGVFLSTLGVIFLVIKGDISNLINFEFNKGDFWVILSSITWATYCILVKYKPNKLKAFEFISIITLLGFIMLFIIYFLMGNTVHFNFSSTVYSSILYMAIFPSLFSYYLWNRGIMEIGANKTGQVTHIMPISGSILAYVFLGENLERYHFYGIVFIAIGIYISLFYKSKKSS